MGRGGRGGGPGRGDGLHGCGGTSGSGLSGPDGLCRILARYAVSVPRGTVEAGRVAARQVHLLAVRRCDRHGAGTRGGFRKIAGFPLTRRSPHAGPDAAGYILTRFADKYGRGWRWRSPVPSRG
jgi:hypothetical protein